MRKLLSAVVALWMGFAGQGIAQETPVVVELYTSQGCSSCPPADKILAQMAGRDDVIPLALHVDYWDYIGWKDKFAHAAFTKRQKGYARTARRQSVYTPQMIINGQDDVIGNRPMDVTDQIRRHSKIGLPAKLTLSRSGGTLKIEGQVTRSISNADVFLVRYKPQEKVTIPRGENAGNTLTYSHIVTEWKDIGDWNGRSTLASTVPVSGSAPVVVIVQGKNHGPIFAAARLR